FYPKMRRLRLLRLATPHLTRPGYSPAAPLLLTVTNYFQNHQKDALHVYPTMTVKRHFPGGGALVDWFDDPQIEVNTIVLGEWDGGASVSVVVTNRGEDDITDWQLSWQTRNMIEHTWNADLSVSGDLVTAAPDSERMVIASGEAAAFGFNVQLGPDGWQEPDFRFSLLATEGDVISPEVPALPVQPSPAPMPGGDDMTPATTLDVSVLKASDWDTGVSANIIVRNTTADDVALGGIRIELPSDASIDSAWNASVIQEGGFAIFQPDADYVTVKAGEAISIGFNASHDAGEGFEIMPVAFVSGTQDLPAPHDEPVAGTPPPPLAPSSDWDGEAPLNPIIGTQTIGPGYTLSDENALVETAKAIRDTGSNILKIALDPTLYGMSSLYQWQPVELLTQNEAFRDVLAMDFDHYFFWLERSGPWADNNGISQEEYDQEYQVTYDLARYLLETFENTGKTFYIGNWETDWNLLEWNPTLETVDDTRIDGLVDWLNLRQDAIDQARADTDASGVSIYHYLEVNRVDDAQDQGFERVVNAVLPRTNVDLVSYSAYDVILTESNLGRYGEALGDNLDYIESLLPEKQDLPFEKRVFIGEFGFYLKYVSAEQQYDLTLDVLEASVEWGVPFSLIWQMYDTSANEGLYLIGPDGTPTALSQMLTSYNDQLQAWDAGFRDLNARPPSASETREKSLEILAGFRASSG
ncbi:cellulose binding domain-containing protein, partial [Roseibium sp. RKSG952]|uniref:cellulose binding domain-containing protein n=1 Tax=Roseibium sp. RKSG952 TaxID=2529384 RepID=UPI0013CA5A83